MSHPTVLIVGASLAGLRAAEALRSEGFTDRIVLVGDEVHRPYDRPPLSKKVLTGELNPHDVMLATQRSEDGRELDIEWLLGRAATALDPAARVVTFDDGTESVYDGLIVATGATPRRLSGWADVDGVHVLRSLDDSVSLREQLAGSSPTVAVVGAGFIGVEVAAACRSLGLDVTVLEGLAGPMIRGIGSQMARVCAALHRDRGVELRLGVQVEGPVVGDDGSIRGVRLQDGEIVEADLVVMAVGATPATGWLEGSGLDLSLGLVCDATCRAAPRVYGAGDVASWESVRAGRQMRVEHWENAQTMGQHAARSLMAELAGTVAESYDPVPWFWSDQHGVKLHVAGSITEAAEVRITRGSIEEQRFLAVFGENGQVTGAFAMNMAGPLMRVRMQIAAGLAWGDAG